MPRHFVQRFAQLVLAVATITFFLPAKPALASPMTYNFTGTVVCVTTSCNSIGSVSLGESATVAGIFQFDDGTETIGSFSFSLPNGITLSGSAGDAMVLENAGGDHSLDLFVFDSNMGLLFSDSAEPGPYIIPRGGPCCENDGFFTDFTETISGKTEEFWFTKGDATPDPSPEPSSLLLLGTGLLALGPVIRRFALSNSD